MVPTKKNMGTNVSSLENQTVFTHPQTTKYLLWNQNQPGFQECWLWQYGKGPFRVLEERPVQTEGGYLGEQKTIRINMPYEPGTWYTIDSPEAISNREYPALGFNRVDFHSKWFSKITTSPSRP